VLSLRAPRRLPHASPRLTPPRCSALPLPRSRLRAPELVGILSGVAAMGYRPGDRWVGGLAAAAAARADHTSGAQMAAIAAALRRLGYDESKPAAWIVA
jgi:hypothetical protein